MRKFIHHELLLEAYRSGIFPMARSRKSNVIEWFSPEIRGIIPLDSFKVSRNTARLIRNLNYEVKFNHSFETVMMKCADRDQTWISDVIIQSYVNLFHHGNAHSVEIYLNEHLIGGLYGVTIGGAFFGESMFQTKKDVAKIALYHCHNRLVERNFKLWDTQFYTAHLGSFGCIEIHKQEYLKLLHQAIDSDCSFN